MVEEMKERVEGRERVKGEEKGIGGMNGGGTVDRSSRGMLYFMFLSLLPISLSFATNGTELQKVLCSVYDTLNNIIPTVAFLLFALAGASYAIGQFFGAEIRAKSQVWAMSMVSGAVIGMLIVMFAKIIIQNLTGVNPEAIC